MGLQNNKKLVVNCTAKIDAVSREIKHSLDSHLEETEKMVSLMKHEMNTVLLKLQSGDITKALLGLQKVTSKLILEQESTTVVRRDAGGETPRDEEVVLDAVSRVP